MIYKFAICDCQEERRKKLLEMLHVFENEYQKKILIEEFIDEKEFVARLDNRRYHLVFFNILQAGGAAELDIAQDVHIKNPGINFISLCPKETYHYYRALAKETASLEEMLSYKKLKKVLIKAIQRIDCKENPEEFSRRYGKIQLKRRVDYIELDRITYLEKKKNYVIVHTLDRDFYSYTDCQELYSKLDKEKFLNTHKNYIINYHLLYSMDKKEGKKRWWGLEKVDYFAVMEGYSQVPIKEAYYPKLFRKFIDEVIKGNAT